MFVLKVLLNEYLFFIYWKTISYLGDALEIVFVRNNLKNFLNLAADLNFFNGDMFC